MLLFLCEQEKPTVVVDDDDEDEILELKDRLAAYNLASSPDHSAGTCLRI